MLRHARALRGVKYDPNQPRVPAGNPTGGRWTSTGGGVGIPLLGQSPIEPNLVMTDAAPDSVLEGAQYGQAQVTIDYSRALTGLSTVENATKELSHTLARTMETVDFIPEWTPQLCGTAVHVAFGTVVRFQGIPGIRANDVEQSFVNTYPAERYGEPGSIRTDVVLRNESGDIVAIYDVKTGGAKLTAARVRELREKTGVASNAPIIELHVLRGASLKGRIAGDALTRRVIAKLWNPLAEDSPDRSAVR